MGAASMGATEATFFNFTGLRQAALGGGLREVIEPATGQVLCSVGIANAADMAAACAASAAAQEGWAAVPPREKAAILRRAGALFEQHFDELALYTARETGG